MLYGHGGNIFHLARQLGCAAGDIIDMSSNINPLGSPPGLLDHLKNSLDSVGALPEVDSRSVSDGMAALLGVAPDRVLAGGGTTQFIYTVCTALSARKVLIVGPTYADYADAVRMHGISPRFYLTQPENDFQVAMADLEDALEGCDTVFLCNPNNPTGTLVAGIKLEALCRKFPNINFIIDESYLPFVPAEAHETMMHCQLDNVIVLYSVSKIYGIPGLRAGFLVAPVPVIQRFRALIPPWSLNSPAQEALTFIIDNPSAVAAFVHETRAYLDAERQAFYHRMGDCPGLKVFDSVTSYLLMQLPADLTSEAVCDAMGRHRILIRNCSNFYGLTDRYARVALKARATNRMAAEKLMEIISQQLDSGATYKVKASDEMK